MQIPLWLLIPFVLLLLLLAAGPLFFPKLWHKYYKHVAVALGVFVGVYYVLAFDLSFLVAETFAEYLSFICLLLALYVASGGIYIFADFESKAKANLIFLLCGAILTNFIGTTGASVLLIRPFMRINRYRLQPYHIVFFIFFVSNMGGLLTPIGDPPLFMGFLRGVPFFWTFQNLFAEWVLAMFLLSIAFYFFEQKNRSLDEVDNSQHYSNQLIVEGKRNILWLLLVILTVFIDPNTMDSIPYIDLHGKKVSFVRELLQLVIVVMCYRFANKKALANNTFDFEPIKEVGFIFFGIFLTMIPALQYLTGVGGDSHVSVSLVYWATGVFSSILDNAPTYVNFFTFILTSLGYDAQQPGDVHQFLASDYTSYLRAISTAAVFFGAMTYIGNGPNFMVKAIAEQTGVKMPNFFGFFLRYSLPILLPILTIIWLVFYF